MILSSKKKKIIGRIKYTQKVDFFQNFNENSGMKKLKLAKTSKNEGSLLDFFGARSVPEKSSDPGFSEKNTAVNAVVCEWGQTMSPAVPWNAKVG